MMSRTFRTARWVGAALVFAVAGCSGPSVSGSDQPGAQAGASVAPGPAGAASRVSIGSSSQPDIAAALDANGVDTPEKWAQIVKQSGPYPDGEAGLAKLRQVLAQFKASPEDTAKITNTLVP